MSQAVRVLLNGEPRAITDIAPTTTALDWLREREGLCGTKEGCGEGDCGACTIVVGDVIDGRLRYAAVNACLLMLGQLDGRMVLTVEGLAGDELHPVQHALVDSDATQCGFCTPGIAMALFAFQKSGEPGETSVIHDVLAGNLCRCTGYRSIVDAARRVAGDGADSFGDQEAELIAAIDSLARGDDTVFEMAGHRFHAPTTVAGVAGILAANPEASLLAGGTDLGLLASKQREPPGTVVSLARVAQLRRIEETESGLEIGAAVTYTELLPYLESPYPSLAALVRRIGSRQIRNLGTIGGNVGTASPVGDMLPCLLALDAGIVLHSSAGTREVAAADFFLAYRQTALEDGEFISAIRLPYLRAGEIFRVYKVSKRFDQDISAVVGAFRLSIDDGDVVGIRIAFGGMAATPKRATGCEHALLGRPWSEASVLVAGAAMAGDFKPIGDHRASAAYRASVAANLLHRLYLQTATPGVVSDVGDL